jgi:hypothetical protein
MQDKKDHVNEKRRQLNRDIHDDDKEKSIIGKKKAKVKVKLTARLLLQYEYILYQDMKIYSGVHSPASDKLRRNIDLYKRLSPCNVLSRLQANTLTVEGLFLNVTHHEVTEISTYSTADFINFDRLLKVYCNYGEIYHYPNVYFEYDLRCMVRSVYHIRTLNYYVQIGSACCGLLDIDALYPLTKMYYMGYRDYEESYKDFLLGMPNVVYMYDMFKKSDIDLAKRTLKTLLKLKHVSSDALTKLYSLMRRCRVDYLVRYVDNLVDMINLFRQHTNKCSMDHEHAPPQQGKMPDPKPKKDPSKRKKQGTALCFNIQTSYDIYYPEQKKVYKIKLFRTGTTQCAGITDPSMQSFLPVMFYLESFINDRFDRGLPPASERTKLAYMFSTMRNYICHVVHPDVDDHTKLKIYGRTLLEIFDKHKHMTATPDEEAIDRLLSYNYPGPMTNDIYMHNIDIFEKNHPPNDIGINIINGESEKYPALVIHFSRGTPQEKEKKVTVKFHYTGKIGFNGFNSELETEEMYYWIQYIFYKYWKTAIFNTDNYENISISDDTDEGYRSIYDSDNEFSI